MIKHNFLQHSQEWHEIRYAKVSGTRAKSLFTETDTLCLEILSEKTEPFNDSEIKDFISKDMQRGNDLEPEARKLLKELTNIDFQEVGWLQSELFEILGISPDGISPDEKAQAEIKCPGRKKHTQTIIEDKIPLDNIHQCIHSFMVNPKLEALYFFSYRPENFVYPYYLKVLKRDTKVDIGLKTQAIKANKKKGIEAKKAMTILIPVSECVKMGLDKIEKLDKKVNDQLTAIIDKLKVF